MEPSLAPDPTALGAGLAVDRVSLADATRVWAKIGLLSFGGPAGQVALMHRELVEQRKWIDEARFLHALNYCMLLPGPEATQLATYIGWLMHRTPGGLIAGTLFVLPGFLAILLLSLLYTGFHQLPAVAALFFGLKAAVLAVVVEAVQRIGKRALKTRFHHGVAALAFVAIFFFAAPFPLIVLGAGALGLITARLQGGSLTSTPTVPDQAVPDTVIERMALSGELTHTLPSSARALRLVVVYLALWALPVVVLGAMLGAHSVFVTEGVFFAKAAVVTFGGAYSVLAYIAQQAVETYGWLKPGEMLDGLGLAETTPGPLIMVVQFVGFLGAYRHPGTLAPLCAGIVGSFVTVWVTFVPCFLWIFLGAPYIEALRGNRVLSLALSSITAAVVGVVLNLSLWFGIHTLFSQVNEHHVGPLRLFVPKLASLDLAAAALCAWALVATFRLKLGLPWTLASSAALGLAYKLVV